MTSEIKLMMMENYKKAEELIANGEFKIGDAQKLLASYGRILDRMEDLETSRNNWKAECERLTKLLRSGK